MSFIVGNIFLFLSLLVLWGYVWYNILTRMNFSGRMKWGLLVCLVLPYSSAIGLIYLAFFPWPSDDDKSHAAKDTDTAACETHQPVTTTQA